MKTILVTGGCGFIGSNFIRHFIHKYDYNIVNLDKLTYCGNLENLEDIEDNPKYKFVRGDICDSGILNEVVGKSDAIINFAAESHVDNSLHNPSEFLTTNILGTMNLLQVARRYKIKRFLQVSTDEVYGSIVEGAADENAILNPSSPYSVSKAAADLLIKSYITTYSLPALITRSTNNYGPYQYPEKLIPKFITNLFIGEKVPLYGDGMNVRDWIYVQDNCEAIDFIFHNGEIGEIYNIGGNNQRTNLEITKLVLDLMGKDENYIKYVADRPGHDRRYSVDSTKISELGWMPKFNFEEGMKTTVDWYKLNEEWWRKLLK